MTEISVNDLTEEDRKSVEAVDKFASSVLTDEKLDEYICEKISGKTTQAIYGEVIRPFVEFLREQAEYFKVDMILDCYEKENKNNG